MDELSTSSLPSWSPALRAAIEHGVWDTAITARLRKMVGEEATAAVLATARLHPKAVKKFGDGIWWCTERSLQQATARPVANLKASWAGGSDMVDVCCGIGGDTLGFVSVCSSVVAVDSDPEMVAMARENLRLNLDESLFEKVEFRCESASPDSVSGGQVVHLDPDRRTEASRVTRPQDYSPEWETVRAIAEKAEGAIIKLAPAAQLDESSDLHHCWISLGGTVREQTALRGSAWESAGQAMNVSLSSRCHSAVVVRGDGASICYAPAQFAEAASHSEVPLEFIADPDAAIRAAGLTETFAQEHDLKLLGKASGFLTGESQPPASLCISEQVLWSGACDDRKLRKTLRQMDCYPQRVKTRGVSQNPNQLEKRYRKCGERPVTLWIGKAGKRQYAAVSIPVGQNAG